jgi:hypothetical protein
MIYPFDNVLWDSRTKKIAKIIPENSSVIDLGAGKQNLKKFLITPSRYVPIDKFELSPDTIVADFNLDQYPDVEPADFMVAQGIIEYLDEPEKFLQRIRKYGDRLVITYREQFGSPGMERKNSFTFTELIDMLEGAGWKVARSIEFTSRHAIFECTKI